MSSKKYDKGKTPWHLVDFKTLEAIPKVLQYGAEKYGENTWQGLENPKDRYFSALIRHLVAWRNGEKIDESGLPHIYHVLCNAYFLTYFDSSEPVDTEILRSPTGVLFTKSDVKEVEDEDFLIRSSLDM